MIPLQQQSWKVYFFTTSRGTSPVLDYINGQEKDDQANIRNYIRLLRDFGIGLRKPYAKLLKGYKPLWELRPMPHRLIYFLHTDHRFFILHAFKKKKYKTDRKELKTAMRRMEIIMEEVK